MQPTETRQTAPAFLPRAGDLYALAAIVALALALRSPYLTQPLTDAFAWREASTAMMAENIPLNGWNPFYPQVNWTGTEAGFQGRELQLYTLIVAVFHHAFGWHDWMGRPVSLAFGLLSVFFLHRLIALCWSERHAHAAALVYAIMPGTIMVETSYLPDAAMLGLALPGLFLLSRYSVGGRRRTLALGMMLFALGIMTKPSGMGLFLAVAFVGLIVARQRVRGRTIFFAGMFLLALDALGVSLLWARYLGMTYPPHHVAGVGYVWEYGWKVFVQKHFYAEELIQVATGWLYGWPILGLMAVGLIRPLDGTQPSRPLAALPALALLGCAVFYLVAAREVTENLWNLHVLSFPAAAFAGRGLVILTGDDQTRQSPAGTALRVAVITAACLWFATRPNLEVMKANYPVLGRKLGQEIERLSESSDLVIALSNTAGSPTAIYYSRRKGWLFPPVGPGRNWARFGPDGPEAIAMLEALRAQGADWFGVVLEARDNRDQRFEEHYPLLIAHLEATARKRLYGGGLLIFDLKP